MRLLFPFLCSPDATPIHALFTPRGAATPPAASSRRNSRSSSAVAAVRRSLSLLIGGGGGNASTNVDVATTAASTIPTSLAVDDEAMSSGISQPVPIYTDYSSTHSSMSSSQSRGSNRERSRRTSFDPSKSEPSSSELSTIPYATRSRSASSTSVTTTIGSTSVSTSVGTMEKVPSFSISSSRSSHRSEGHPRTHMLNASRSHTLLHARGPASHSRSPSASRSMSSSIYSQTTRVRSSSNSSQRGGMNIANSRSGHGGGVLSHSTTTSVASRSEGRPYTMSTASSRSTLLSQNSSSSLHSKSDSRPHVSSIFRGTKTPRGDAGGATRQAGYHKPQQPSLSSSVSSVASETSTWSSSMHLSSNVTAAHASNSWPASHASTPTTSAAAKQHKAHSGSNPLTPMSRGTHTRLPSSGTTPLPFHMRASGEHHTPRQDPIMCGASSSSRISLMRPNSEVRDCRLVLVRGTRSGRYVFTHLETKTRARVTYAGRSRLRLHSQSRLRIFSRISSVYDQGRSVSAGRVSLRCVVKALVGAP